MEDFRSVVFNSLLDERDLRGPKFVIDPPRNVLDLIAALGPVDVERREFQQSAQTLLGKPFDEVLQTIDALAANGIVTPRPKPVRVIPDVLSDYIFEQRCISAGGQTTHYADRVYEHFGVHSLRELMRNLAELDWRRGQAAETGLNLLNGIWNDIHQRFRAGDEYVRHSILSDLAGAAIYQPDNVIALVRVAIDDPVHVDPSGEGSRFRSGQEYVLSTLPNLLEATAHHPERLKESVTTLWELAKRGGGRESTEGAAKSVLKRLASWHRFGHPALNFGMLVQAIRLAGRGDAFTSDFTPFTLINRILEREGEYGEWHDENSYSFGGFGLNYSAVGPIRENALDYLEFALAGDGSAALHAIPIMETLLHNFLTRMGRERTPEEIEWQNRERERCLRALVDRYALPATALLKARIYDALRSATAVNCPEVIRQMATAALAEITVDDAVAVVDAICTAEHDLPILTTEFDEIGWERPISALESGAIQVIRAAASNLRVFEGASEHDIAVIQAYGGYPDPVVKRGAIFAITYMGKFVELRESLKEAVLSIHAEGDESVAADLADAFGPYGVPLTMLTREEAASLASEFIHVRDWEHDHGAIPRFLSRLAILFPDEVYDLLCRRIGLNAVAKENRTLAYPTFGFTHERVSFGGTPAEKRLQLAQDCIDRLLKADSGEEFAALFWDLAGYDVPAFTLIVNSAGGIDDLGVQNIAKLIDKAVPRLAFTHTGFVREFLRLFTGTQRERLVEAFAHQARHFGGGVYTGDYEAHIAQRERDLAGQIGAFPDDPGLNDLGKALRRYM